MKLNSENNAMPNKEYLRLLPNEYYDGCKSWSFQGQTYRESTNHKSVNGWKGTSEYQILDENEDGYGPFHSRGLKRTLMLFNQYDLAKTNSYTYQMYSRGYLDWTCQGTRRDFTDEAKFMNDALSRMQVVHILVWVSMGFVFIEMIFFFM